MGAKLGYSRDTTNGISRIWVYIVEPPEWLEKIEIVPTNFDDYLVQHKNQRYENHH